MDYRKRFETGDVDEFRKTYFRLLADSAETGLFDSLAHPDLIKNYHPQEWDVEAIRPEIEAALDRIAKTSVAMELNTSGLIKSYEEMNPGLAMLRMMQERGIPVVVGSDSHRPSRVAEHFVVALKTLQTAGYDKVSVFENRKRGELAISDVLASLAANAVPDTAEL
ncbi:MAG: histidinol phosphatase [Verrucomicrobiaceae bacterium]|nr:histidinol phosphatase [Verrucomicrobiaceae bacterium]